jgi:hypothetical protein
MSFKKLKHKYSINSFNNNDNNLKISMSHKNNMKKFSNNDYIIVDPVLNKSKKIHSLWNIEN